MTLYGILTKDADETLGYVRTLPVIMASTKYRNHMTTLSKYRIDPLLYEISCLTF